MIYLRYLLMKNNYESRQPINQCQQEDIEMKNKLADIKKKCLDMGIDYVPDQDFEPEDWKEYKRKEAENATLQRKVARSKEKERCCKDFIKRRMAEEVKIVCKVKTEHKTYNIKQIEIDLVEGDTLEQKLRNLRSYYVEKEGQYALQYYANQSKS